MTGQATVAPSWRQPWLDAVAPTDAAALRRFERGAAWARRGRVSDVDVAPGRITARVHQDRVRPHDVAVTVPVPDEDAWHRAVVTLAGELRHTAALLEGRLSHDFDRVLEGSGVALLPAAGEAATRCTCDEPGPCSHAGALHHAFAAAVDREPGLLLRLRGRDRDRLLTELRRRRSGSDEATATPAALPVDADVYSARGDLDAIALRPAPPDDPGTLLRHLGPPPGMSDTVALERLVRRAAVAAWRIASGEGARAADDELLLAELRAQGSASSAAVATALGWEEPHVRAALDRLFAAGTVLRTGQGDDARYRAATSP